MVQFYVSRYDVLVSLFFHKVNDLLTASLNLATDLVANSRWGRLASVLGSGDPKISM